jgi:hypothetical protein
MQQFFEDSHIIEPLHQGPLTEHFGSYILLQMVHGGITPTGPWGVSKS